MHLPQVGMNPGQNMYGLCPEHMSIGAVLPHTMVMAASGGKVTDSQFPS